MSGLVPAERVSRYGTYRRQTAQRENAQQPAPLMLDANVAAPLDPDDGPETARYPDTQTLETQLAARLGISPSAVLVTAGADDALDRLCRAMLEQGRSAIVTEPTFEMIPRFIASAGGTCISVPWQDGPFPAAEVASAADADASDVAMAFVVSPNNPTGAVADADALANLARALPQVLIVLDHAYVEFADHDLTAFALSLPNVVVVRSLSKAWGLAGLRVGYLAGPPDVVEWARRSGLPYAVSGTSLALAARRLVGGAGLVRARVARVREEVARLGEALATLGATPRPSQANFVLAKVPDARLLADLLRGLGITVRTFPSSGTLHDFVRISVPASEPDMVRLEAALGAALAPRALLFDLDGVIADVRGSYRVAIVETARAFGVDITPAEVSAMKALGDANNDWVVTWRLLRRAGVDVSLGAVTERFESLVQGSGETVGLHERETLLVPRNTLRALRDRARLGVVTGRPRRDALRFLERHSLRELFEVVVCMEDGPAKPSPEPVACALRGLGVDRAWLVGDTVDDMVAARAAGVVPFGIVAPSDEPTAATRSLLEAGAARVVTTLSELLELWP